MNFNNNFNNNLNNGLNNNFSAGNVNSDNASKSQICIIFTFEKYDKDIFLDANKYDSFGNVINELKEKYSWLKSLRGLSYKIRDKLIEKGDFQKTLQELDIKDDDNLVIHLNDVPKKTTETVNVNHNKNLSQNNHANENTDNILINFKIYCGDSLNNNNMNCDKPITLPEHFNKKSTVNEVLRYYLGEKVGEQVQKLNLTFGDDDFKGINDKDLDITLEGYLSKNGLTGGDFTIHFRDPEVKTPDQDNKIIYDHEVETPDRDNKTKGKNKWLLITGIILIALGLAALKFFAPEIILVLIITGVGFVVLGFFWEKLPCCSGNSISKISTGSKNQDNDLCLSKYKDTNQGFDYNISSHDTTKQTRPSDNI